MQSREAYAAKLFIDISRHYRAELPQQTKNMDTVVTWLTGLSSGAIALLLAQSKSLDIVNSLYIKLSIFGFIGCVVCAAIHRFVSHKYLQRLIEQCFAVENYCRPYMENIKWPLDEIDENMDKGLLLILLNERIKVTEQELGVNLESMLEPFGVDDIASLGKANLVYVYKELADEGRKRRTEFYKGLSIILAPLLNESPKKIEDRMVNNNQDREGKRKNFKWMYRAYDISCCITMMCFCLGIVSISLGYVCAI